MAAAKKTVRGLCAICGPGPSGGSGHLEVAKGALAGGASMVQLRDKRLPVRELYGVALELKTLVAEYGAVFIINDSVELALAVDADGVHLGQDDLPVGVARRLLGAGKIIGVSTHSIEEALCAQDGGADYIGFGPIFRTTTKDAGVPKGVAGLRLVRERIKIPIVAIGGITAANAKEVRDAGADAVAVISALAGAADVEEAAREILRRITDG